MGEDILVSGVYDLRKLVANAYSMSKPVGMGFRQYKEGELSEEEISYLIKNYVSGVLPDYQMSAFLMAVYFRGMTEKERHNIYVKFLKELFTKTYKCGITASSVNKVIQNLRLNV